MIKKNKLKPCLILIFILFILFVMTESEAFALWYSSDWSFRQKITIDSSMVPGDLSNFPVLVDVTNTNLIASPGGNVGKLNGGDILFTNSNGTIKLDHEIESYNNATGALVAWVEVPAVWSTADTVFYMYYGNAGAADQWNVNGTWDEGGANNFLMVQHLQEISGTHFDSTVNGNDGTAFGGVTQNALGQINGADEFDGLDDYIAIQNLNYNTAGQIDKLTVCAWFNTSLGGGGSFDNWAIVDFDRSDYYNFFIYGDTGEIGFSTGGTGIVDMQGNTPANDGFWHYGCVVFDSSLVNDKMIYLDGGLDAQQDAYTIGTNLGTGNTRYGFIGDGSEAIVFDGDRNGLYYEGFIDEFRISNTARTPDWIETSFNNQDDPSSFLSFDAQEIFVPAPTMTEWGMIIFMVFAGMVSMYYLRRKGVV